MAELLIRVYDKTNPDSIYLDAGCCKRGDVIAIQDDGWPWGSQELTLPIWRIIKITGVPAANLTSLLTPESVSNPNAPVTLQRKRGYFWDIDTFLSTHPAVATWFTDDTRAQPIRAIALTGPAFLALQVQKPALVDTVV